MSEIVEIFVIPRKLKPRISKTSSSSLFVISKRHPRIMSHVVRMCTARFERSSEVNGFRDVRRDGIRHRLRVGYLENERDDGLCETLKLRVGDSERADV